MSRVRLLLVEDEPETAATLRSWAERRGYEAVHAAGPEQADTVLDRDGFDVVLSDIHMPGNHQLEWIERRLQSECPPPFLLMTGNPELETAMRAANLPVAGYLLKPFDYESAAAHIERLGADYRRRRELLALSAEVDRLLAQRRQSPAAPDRVCSDELHRLAQQLAAEAKRSPRESIAPGRVTGWREAVCETIAVLEKTKQSFRSKELGELRRRLQRLVP